MKDLRSDSSAPAKKQRNRNLDLIRATATLLVLCSHFLLKSAFYDELVMGKRMYVMVVMRYVFMACVPIFLILTGYLNGNKKPEKAYFKKITGTLVIYVMASVVCLLFSYFYHEEEFTFVQGILRILDFNASSYAWYVEMYIGLYLLIPFLNILYHGLKDQKQQRILLGVLIFITSAPTLFNVLDLSQPTLALMHESRDFSQVVPEFWTFLYPVEYYMIGMYIREHGFSWSPRKTFLAILAAILVFANYNYWRIYGRTFSFFSPWVGRNSVQNLIISVLIFGFLLNLKLDKIPNWLFAPVRKISELSFVIFLLSSATDKIVYAYLWMWVPMMTDRLNYFVPCVLASLLWSMAMGQILVWIQKGGKYALNRLKAHKTPAM